MFYHKILYPDKKFSTMTRIYSNSKYGLPFFLNNKRLVGLLNDTSMN